MDYITNWTLESTKKKYLHNFNFILLSLSVAFYNKVRACYTHEQCFIWCLTVCFALPNFQMDMQQLTAKNTHYTWIWQTISTLVCPLKIMKVFNYCWTSHCLGSTILTSILITDQQQHAEFSQIWGVTRLHFDTVSSY
jgi:hypothetical protein